MKRTATLLTFTACLGLGQAAAAQELTGTPYSVVWRGAGYAQMPGYGRHMPAQSSAGVMLRLVDVAARREMARAVFDSRLGGWMFQMPFNAPQVRAGHCLALVDGRNQFMPVRPSSAVDAGTAFRNPLWERELSRAGELAELKKEHATVEAQSRSAAGDIARLSAEIGLPPGADASQCPVPPVPPDPPRPAGALEPAQAASISGAVCAWRWERDHGARVNLARIFADAGLDADWRDRNDTAAAAAAESMPTLRVPITGGDLALVMDAAAKGRTFMEHADGVRVLTRAQAACRAEVGRHSSAVRQRWTEAVQESRQTPERARMQCAHKLGEMARLRAAQSAAPTLLAALDKKISQLSSPPGATDSMPLQTQLCQP